MSKRKATKGASAPSQSDVVLVCTEACGVTYRGHTLELKAGQIIDDPGLARFLLETGAPVEERKEG